MLVQANGVGAATMKVEADWQVLQECWVAASP